MEQDIKEYVEKIKDIITTLLQRISTSNFVVWAPQFFNAEHRHATSRRWLLAILLLVLMYLVLMSFVFATGSLGSLTTYDDVYVSKPARLLPKKGRLLCFVITTPRYHDTRVLAVNETWLPRCDHGQFFTSDELLPSIPYSIVLSNIPDDYNYLFQKTLISFHYAFTQISDQFEWYYKADDDTYVIMEHMYNYLKTLDPNEPYYLGYTMRPYLPRGYNGGGAGYVLSRAALKLFIDRAFYDRSICPFDQSEDVGIGRCLQNLEIYPHDTRNSKGQPRFNTYRPDDMFYGTVFDEWHYYPQIKGHDWIADDLISIHHLRPAEIRVIDDFLYRLKSPQLLQADEQIAMEHSILYPLKKSTTTEARTKRQRHVRK